MQQEVWSVLEPADIGSAGHGWGGLPPPKPATQMKCVYIRLIILSKFKLLSSESNGLKITGNSVCPQLDITELDKRKG